MTWSAVPFASLIEFNPSVPLKRGGVYPFLPMEAVSPDRKYSCPHEQRPFTGGGARFQDGDILFARITPCLENGKITRISGLSEYAGFGSTEFFVLRAKPGVSDPDFIYYLAQSRSVREPAIMSMVGASGRQRANADAVKKAIVRVPDLKTQKKISAFLARYDSLIECNRQRISALEEFAIRLFQEWFVQLRFPGHANTARINGIPAGWEACVLSDVADINPRTKAIRDKENIYIPMSSLSEALSVVSEVERRVGTGGTKFRNGDTLLARITPCIENGKTALVQFLAEDEVGIGSTEFIVLRPKRVNPFWLYCLARTHHLRHTAINSMKGSDGRQRVNPECFSQYPILLPPEDLLRSFEGIAGSAFKTANLLMAQNRKLAMIRDALSPRVLSGQLYI